MLDRKNGSQSECNWTREKTVYGSIVLEEDETDQDIKIGKIQNSDPKKIARRIGGQLCAMFDVGQENVGPLECDWVRICVVGWRGTRLFYWK